METDVNIYKEETKINKQFLPSNNLKNNRMNIINNKFKSTNTNVKKYKHSSSDKINNKSLKFLNKEEQYQQKTTIKLTEDQIQFVIDNWKKYALQNGWKPPVLSENENHLNFKDISPTRKNNSRPKFLGLLNRKLIPINQNNANNITSIQSEIYFKQNNNKKDNNKFLNKEQVINHRTDKNDICFTDDNKRISLNTLINKKSEMNNNNILTPPAINKKKRTNNNNNDIHLIDSKNKNSRDHHKKRPSISVGPQRTTQYRLINDFSLDDDFPDKLQRCFNSDPPPRFSAIDESDISINNSSEKDFFESDRVYAKTQSSPGLITMNQSDCLTASSGSNADDFLSQNDILFQTQHSSLINGVQISEFPKDIESNSNNKTNFNSYKSSQIRIDTENANDVSKSSFESLEAMIKIPTVPKSPNLKYTITNFDNLFDAAPTISFGKKEIISVQVFRTRPNPSEKLNTMYYYIRSKANKRKEKFPPPLPFQSSSEPQIAIKKSPSLEKILQDGFMDSGLNISGIYNDSSSED